METKNLPLSSFFSSTKKTLSVSKDLEEELEKIDTNLELNQKNSNVNDYLFVLECKVHEKNMIRYICCDSLCNNERLLCPKCMKESSHYELHKSSMREYQKVLEEKYEELMNIHEKLEGNLQVLEKKTLIYTRKKVAFKKAKFESRKTIDNFKKIIEEIKTNIKEIYHEIVTKMYESSLDNYGKFLQNNERIIRNLEEEFLYIKENSIELEKILQSKIDYVVLEKLITEYAPLLKNSGINEIINSLNIVESRISNFEIFDKNNEKILLKEFKKIVSEKIKKIINEYLDKFDVNKEEKNNKRIHIKNLIRNRQKQIYKPGKFSQNKSSLGKSTTHSMKNLKNLYWTDSKNIK